MPWHHNHHRAIDSLDVLFEVSDPLVGGQLVVLVVREDVDPQKGFWLLRESSHQSRKELSKVIFPGMTYEHCRWSHQIFRVIVIQKFLAVGQPATPIRFRYVLYDR